MARAASRGRRPILAAAALMAGLCACHPNTIGAPFHAGEARALRLGKETEQEVIRKLGTPHQTIELDDRTRLLHYLFQTPQGVSEALVEIRDGVVINTTVRDGR
ncbi:MAG: hypothetical protein GMKNLPBB_00435 [Myxococcota bacterium]|nr:hypothetical protein [Myxococcota bacterium]